MTTPSPDKSHPLFRPLSLLSGVAVVLLLGTTLWVIGDVLVLIFSGLLLAVMLINLSRLVEAHTKFGYGWSLAVVVGTLAFALSMLTALFAAQVVGETQGLLLTIESKWEELTLQIKQHPWTPELKDAEPLSALDTFQSEWLARVAGWFTSTFGILMSLFLIAVIGIYAAVDPELYQRGLLHLVPLAKRQRAQEVLEETACKLWWWILGQLLSMTAVGITTTIGLWVLGIPFAATLGLLSGLLTFVPNFGPILSALPAILLALSQGILPALYVTLLYTAIQTAESNLLTPLVQQRNVKLPPVVNVGFQILLGVLFGVPGLIVAAPLAVVAMVLTKRLYIEDCLGDWLSSASP